MWLVMISNPSLRPPALNYLLRKLPKISDREAVAVVLGGKENVSLMVRAFSSTLHDQQVLVQRGMLELLVQNFVLKSRMIPHEDLVILIRAALCIVLRKDMSLNRRLYAWLLGSEAGNAQVAYFSTYAEKPAIQAVRGMLHDKTNPQKPYKILISLMDKSELGQPIVNHVFIDALTSLKGQLNPEVMQTANMWMDMMEPYSICMKLFEILDTCFPPNKKMTDHMDLIGFTLEEFHLTDEEIKQIHYPFMLASLSRKLKEALKSPTFVSMLPQVNQCIQLILELLRQLPDSVYVDRTAPPPPVEDDRERKQFTPDSNILDYVREYYGLAGSSMDHVIEEEESRQDEEQGDLSSSTHMKKYQSTPATKGPHFEPLRGQLLVKQVADDLTEFLIEFVKSYIVLPENLVNGVDVGEEGKRLKRIDHHVERVLSNTCTAILLIAKQAESTTELKRQDAFTRILLKCCQTSNVFGVVDASVSILTALIHQQRFVQVNVLKHMHEVKEVVDKLWGFLNPSMQMLHMRTVALLWLVIDASFPHQIETILSNFLIHQEDEGERLHNYEKFGILWELSEERPESSIVFSRPMFLMLDLLRDGTSPLDRRAGETWIRCHLKSYVRLLEPFMMDLLDKHILRQPVDYTVDWKNQVFIKSKTEQEKTTDIPYFVYVKPFDSGVIDYLFTTLNTLITFGGLNVLKSCKSHTLDIESRVTKAAEATGIPIDTTTTFLDLLVSVSIRYLETECSEKLSSSLLTPICSIQLHAADLLYLIISKLDFVHMKLVQQIQTSVINKLLYCISTKNLDLQQKLLHLLHASLAITCASTHQPGEKGHQKKPSMDSISSIASLNEALTLVQSSTDLFVKCVTDALTLTSNRSMLQHWMDFVLATLPYVKNGFRFILVPILMCVCNQINTRCDTIEITMHEKTCQCYLFQCR